MRTLETSETRGRKRLRKRNLKKIVLETVAAAGILAVALAAPNALGAFRKLGIIPSPYDASNITRARTRLIRDGLLVQGGGYLRLTDKGKKALRLLQLGTLRLKKPARWDGRWRILIFDIPEYRKSVREKIRRTLAHIGFIRLQDSVWAYPYDCEDTVALLKADFKTGKNMLYMIVDELEGDLSLKKSFKLQ